MKRLLALAFLFSLTAACGPKCPPRGKSANAVISPPAVDVLIAAFNRADAEALIATTHPDVEWMFVQGDKIAVETRGQEALRASMTSYFKSTPGVRSVAEAVTTNGNFTAVRERVHWKSKDGTEKTQSALAVYELTDGKIRRVWYYPEQP